MLQVHAFDVMLHYCTLPLSFTRFTVTYHTVYSIHEVTGTEQTCAYHAPHWWFTGLWNCLILTFKAEDLVLFDQVPCPANMFINTIRHTSRMVCLYYIRMHVYIYIILYYIILYYILLYYIILYYTILYYIILYYILLYYIILYYIILYYIIFYYIILYYIVLYCIILYCIILYYIILYYIILYYIL